MCGSRIYAAPVLVKVPKSSLRRPRLAGNGAGPTLAERSGDLGLGQIKLLSWWEWRNGLAVRRPGVCGTARRATRTSRFSIVKFRAEFCLSLRARRSFFGGLRIVTLLS